MERAAVLKSRWTSLGLEILRLLSAPLLRVSQAQFVSATMMCVIVLSIGSFTIASNPDGVWFTDVWVNLTTGETIVGSNMTETGKLEGAYLSDGPRRVSTEVDESRSPFFEVETFCIMVFTAEYVLRLLCSPQGPGVWGYVSALPNIIDLVSILPWFIENIMLLAGIEPSGIGVLSVLRLIRLTRITRIFKMSKNFQAIIMLLRSLRKSFPALLMLFAFMVRSQERLRSRAHPASLSQSADCLWQSLTSSRHPCPPRLLPTVQGISGILFATLIFTVESGTYDPHRHQYVRVDGSASPFESIPGAFWWTIVTMTTVGYGDQYPVTVEGKVIAVLTMFCGLIVLSLPITIIGANFDDEYRELRKRAQEEKERQRRAERRERLRQAKEMQQLGGAAGTPGAASVPGAGKASTPTPTPSKEAGGGDGETEMGAIPLTYPPGSPVVASYGDATNDPIKIIQTMIHESHYELTRDVERIMLEHESKLRTQIKKVLRQHATGLVDLRTSPLDQNRPVEPSGQNER